MRLEVLSRSLRWVDRARFAWRELKSGRQITDLQRALRYRADFFGKPFLRYWRHAQYDGRCELSVGQRQVLAAVISQSNRCQFCTVAHAEAATRHLSRESVDQILRDTESTAQGDALAELAQFTRRLALRPREISSGDVDRLRQLGIGDDDIETAIHLCAVYCIMNRIADAIDFDIPDLYALDVDDGTREIRVPRASPAH